MNNKIKNVSIVLTTGVLLGFGTSAALADNVVGVGMYGTAANPAMADDASAATKNLCKGKNKILICWWRVGYIPAKALELGGLL